MTTHHEDVRRANERGPRTDRPDLDDAVWESMGGTLRFVLLRARLRDLRVELHRPDGQRHAVGKEGSPQVVLSGPPVEVLLYLQGRREASGAELTGDPEAVERLKAANLAI